MQKGALLLDEVGDISRVAQLAALSDTLEYIAEVRRSRRPGPGGQHSLSEEGRDRRDPDADLSCPLYPIGGRGERGRRRCLDSAERLELRPQERCSSPVTTAASPCASAASLMSK